MWKDNNYCHTLKNQIFILKLKQEKLCYNLCKESNNYKELIYYIEI